MEASPILGPRSGIAQRLAEAEYLSHSTHGCVGVLAEGETMTLVKAVVPEKIGAAFEDFMFLLDPRVNALRNVHYAVNLVECEVDGSIAYLTSPYLAGPSLQEVVKAAVNDRANDLLPLSTIRFYMAVLVDALESLHIAGVIVRHWSLDSIRLASDGYPRLCNMLWCTWEEGKSLNQCVGNPCTRAFEVVCCDEQALRMLERTGGEFINEEFRTLDTRQTQSVDFFGLGALFFEMVTRKRLTEGTSLMVLEIAMNLSCTAVPLEWPRCQSYNLLEWDAACKLGNMLLKRRPGLPTAASTYEDFFKKIKNHAFFKRYGFDDEAWVAIAERRFPVPPPVPVERPPRRSRRFSKRVARLRGG